MFGVAVDGDGLVATPTNKDDSSPPCPGSYKADVTHTSTLLPMSKNSLAVHMKPGVYIPETPARESAVSPTLTAAAGRAGPNKSTYAGRKRSLKFAGGGSNQSLDAHHPQPHVKRANVNHSVGTRAGNNYNYNDSDSD